MLWWVFKLKTIIKQCRKKYWELLRNTNFFKNFRKCQWNNKKSLISSIWIGNYTGKRNFPDWSVNTLTNKCVGVFQVRRLHCINFNWLKVRVSGVVKNAFLAKIDLLRLVRYDWEDFTKRVNFGVEIARWVGVNLWELVKNWQARTGVGYSNAK